MLTSSFGHLLHSPWATWMPAISRGSGRRCQTHSAGTHGSLWPNGVPAVKAGRIEACDATLPSGTCHTHMPVAVGRMTTPTLSPTYCLCCFSAEDVSRDCSPLSFWTLLPGSLPASPLLAAFPPPFHVAVPKKTGHSGTSLSLLPSSLFSGNEKCLQDAQECMTPT